VANPGGGGQWVRGNQNVQVSQVTGSTINVRIDGGPPREVPLEPAVVPPGRNASPARLLRARSGVVPFVDRAGLLSGLTEWMTDPDPFAGYLVGGRGGSGKTRLGVQLSVEAGQREWLCGLLSRATDLAQLEELAGTPTPRLVVIDYAESRGEQLEALLPRLSKQATQEWPVRVLLLVRAAPRRSDDWTEPLRGRGDWLDAILDDVQVRVLDDSLPTPDERATLFGSAAAAFAALAQPDTDPGTVAVPEPPAMLGGPAFTSPLLVTVAAYLAVHPDGKVPTSRGRLLDELIDREDRHWQATGLAHQVEVGDGDLRRRVVAVITLAGADTETEAADLLGLLPDLSDSSETGRRLAVARWGRDLYPGPRWWNPLEPDLLGEHLVATELAGFGEVLTGVLQRDNPAALAQPLDVYARAVVTYPDLAAAVGAVLSTHLKTLCRAAIGQAAAQTNLDLLLGTTTAAEALNQVLTVVDVDPAALPVAVDLFPVGADQVLGPLTLTLTEKITEHSRRQAASDAAAYEPVLAGALNNLSVRLGEAGRRDEALTASQDAVTIRRRLAAANPAAYEPALALSLNNLSLRLADAGRRDEALTTSQDATEVYRRLAAANPAAYEPDLAASLNNLSNRLGEAGRRDEALTTSQNAVQIRRQLAAANPAAYEPDLAMSLNNLSNRLAEAGRRDEAERASREASELGMHGAQ